ncbi:MAG: heterodisulfide reductase-related iron-sulfur binding cluster [Alphaproteobacteria bacterium]
MQEGGLKAPTRHPIPWQEASFYDAEALEAETRRIFDICHGCRRCFNLCDSFPRLFDLIDEYPSGELDTVPTESFRKVTDACTLCDMCFMVACPYVPPHEFNVDFPHLMLRHRAVQHQAGETPWAAQQLASTDRNGKLGTALPALSNWATKSENKVTRPLLEKTLGVDRRAHLPAFASQPFAKALAQHPALPNPQAPGFGEKVVLYATCYMNYNDVQTGLAARAVLAHNGVQLEVVYPECCGMPQLEQGNLGEVAQKAEAITRALLPWVKQGYTVVPLVPSCTLMIRQEWPLLLPENPVVGQVAQRIQDLSEYLVSLSRGKGLVDGLAPLEAPVTLHMACHARAQNKGRQAELLLKLIPGIALKVVERCSGHGGTWGIFKENFDTAVKVGKPATKQILQTPPEGFVVSECPLALSHLEQMCDLEAQKAPSTSAAQRHFTHPIHLIARAYGLNT